MTGRDLAWRGGGVVALAGAGGASLLHRDVLAAHMNGPASPLEFVFGLVSFALASFGILLLWHGASLRDGSARDCERRDETASEQLAPRNELEEEHAQGRPNAIAYDPYALPGGRTGIAAVLADRAISAAAANSKRLSRPPDSMKAGQSS